MQAQVKEQENQMSKANVADIDGNGNLEGFLILSHYVSVFGINNEKAMTFNEKMLAKFPVDFKRIGYDILFWGFMILSFCSPGLALLKMNEGSFFQFSVIFPSIILGVLVVIVFLFLSLDFFNKRMAPLNETKIKGNLEAVRKDIFLKKFGIDMNKPFKEQKSEIYLYLSWVQSFVKKFLLSNRSFVDSNLKSFQYLDESENKYEGKVKKIVLDVTGSTVNDIRGNINGSGDFLKFWQTEKDKQFERLKEKNQMILMDKISKL